MDEIGAGEFIEIHIESGNWREKGTSQEVYKKNTGEVSRGKEIWKEREREKTADIVTDFSGELKMRMWKR